jgi:hypothetical protein
MNRPPYRVFSAALLLFVGLFAAGAAESGGVPPLVEVPMLLCSGRPGVEVSVPNYPPFRMVVDTASETSCLDVVTAVDMGLDLKPLAPEEGKAGAARYAAIMKDVHLGDAALGDVSVVVMDLRPPRKDGTFPAAEGSLGVAVFSGRVLNLDFKARRVGISVVPKQDVQIPRSPGAPASPPFGKATLAWW